MAQNNKVTFSVSIDENLYKKMVYIAEKEHRNLNNHILHMIRSNTEYYERVHGKIDPNKIGSEKL